MKWYKSVFAVLLMAGLFLISAANIKVEGGNLAYAVGEIDKPEQLGDAAAYTRQIDSEITSNLIGGNNWNEAYGEIWKLLGKKEENGFKYVRDKDGVLYSGNFWNTSDLEAEEVAARIRRLQDAVESNGTKVVFLIYPTKYNEAWSDGYYGIPYNNYNAYADEVEMYCRRYNVDYIDYRSYYIEEEKSAEDIFYRTDHHWTVPAAFDGFVKLTDYLNENYDAGLDPDYYYRDLDNYVVETYEDVYLGSQGRDAGISYAGLDDYTFIYPEAETDYEYTYVNMDGVEGKKSGDILHTLIDKKYLDYEDYYTREMNNSYLIGICNRDRIVNLNNPEGLNVLFLRDSYSSPLATFFSSYCSTVDMMWSVKSDGASIEKQVMEGDYDYIFVALAMDSINSQGVPFFAEETEEIEEVAE